MQYREFELHLSKTGYQAFLTSATKADLESGISRVTEASQTVEHAFSLPTGTLKMREDLQRLEAYSLSSSAAIDDFHIQFGRTLFQSALGGAVGEEFSKMLLEQRRVDGGVRLKIRVDDGAPELMNLPWELLHDGDDFLVTRVETPISRLPVGLQPRIKPRLDHTLRMLVVVSSPLDLPGQMILNTEKEQEVILAALDKLQHKRLIDIDFCEEATLDTIQDYLSEQEYDILHFTGHGVFNEDTQRGELLLEDEQGNQNRVSNDQFAEVLRNHPSLRLVVLSACQSARTANNTAYADMASRLTMQGTPAVLAMQYSVLDEAATLFADRFYTGLANNKPLDVALTDARLALRQAGRDKSGERIDFATPVLLLSDPDCVNASQIKASAEDELDTPLDFGTVTVMDRGFVGRHRELRRIRNSFAGGRQRAFIIHGMGGMGKSVLATRAATKVHKSFRGVKAVRMTENMRPEDILEDLNVFLNIAGVDNFNRILMAKAPLAAKTGALAQILSSFPLLIIFDNFEDVLSAQRLLRADGPTPAAPKNDNPSGIADPELAEFFEILIKSVAKGSRFLFTTRYDFDPARGRLTGETEHIALGEMPFAIAVQCMNNHEALAKLPVVAPRQEKRATQLGDSVKAAAPPITKHELFGALGGHPYTIDVFARRAAVTSVADVWLEIQGVEQELIEFTLLDRTYAQLTPAAQTLLMRASILSESPSLEELEWMMGENGSASVESEVRALLYWGMLSREETKAGVVYPMHALVRDFALAQLANRGEKKADLLSRAGRFWELQSKAAQSAEGAIGSLLKARDYHYQAGNFVDAYSIVHMVRESLMRWGRLELLLKLTSESVKTSTGTDQVVFTSYLAMLYSDLGDRKTALKLHQELLLNRMAAGDLRRAGISRHEVALIQQALGNFAVARAHYEANIVFWKSLPDLSKTDRFNQMMAHYHLALLNMDEGRLEEAETGLEFTLTLGGELEDARTLAMCLRELGQINYARGNLEPAEKRVRESMVWNIRIQNKQGVAHCHLLLGKICLKQGRMGEAQVEAEKGASLFHSMGMRNAAAGAIFLLGEIHKAEGHPADAIEKYLHALSIFADTGDHDGQRVAAALYNLQTELGQEQFDSVTRKLGMPVKLVRSPEGLSVQMGAAAGEQGG